MKTWLEAPLKTLVRPALLACALAPSAWATTETLSGSGNWTVPAGVTSVTVEMWGGGGGGGAETSTSSAGCGGGGGGAGYSRATIATTPGGAIAYSVGAGGTGGAAAGGAATAGGNSTFTGVGNAVGGGAGGNSTAGAAAGTGGSGATASGGAGQIGSATGQTGGAGGGAGGWTGAAGANGAAGGSVTTRVGGIGGGTAPSKGGDGGTAVSATAGAVGGAPGAGGAAGSMTGVNTRAGGNGGAGTIILTYTAAGALPTVTLPTAVSITTSGATLGANVIDAGVTDYGVVYSETSVNNNPQVGGTGVTKVSMGSSNPAGAFSGSASGLTLATGYSYAGYATNSSGTAYSSVSTFSTLTSEPSSQPTFGGFTNAQRSSYSFNWSGGNGSSYIVLVKSGGAVDSSPVDGTTYTANAAFGSGTQIGTGNYVVYSGSGTSVSISGLTAGTTYHVAVYSLNGSGATTNYLTTSPATGSQAATANNYYSGGATFDPTNVNDWWINTDGTGSHPANFTTGDNFIIQSGHTMTAAGIWTVSGTGSTVTINSGGKLDMNGFALKLAGNFINNGTFVSGAGAGSVTFTPTGTPSSTNLSSTYTFRPGASAVGVLVQGSGGGGGGAASAGQGGGGGGGACAYSSSVAVSPTTDYTVTVGVGGFRGTNSGAGAAGANSQFSGGSITPIIANGGAGGANLGAGGAGGTASGATVNNAGGAGATGGGGGGGAGETGAGTAATAGTGGSGGSGTISPGGAGGALNAAGSAPGGGGGGANSSGAGAQGTSGGAGQVVVVYPVPTAPTVSTPTATSVTDTTATLGATVTANGGAEITSRGTVWGTSANPTGNSDSSGGTAMGVFTQARTSLPAGTQIFYRGYATNSVGTGYSADGSFYTASAEPTSASSGMGFTGTDSTSMTVNWTSGDGGRRIVIAKQGSAPSGTPVDTTQYTASATYGSGTALAGGYVVYDGTGNSVTVSGLSASITYHFVVYEYNWNGTETQTINYLTSSALSGSETTTSGPATVSTPTVSSIDATTATLGADVTSDGGGALSARGTVWGTSPSPTGNALAEGGTTTGVFTQARTGLPAATLIYYRGYATNSGGTAYSSDGSFYTLSTEPTTSAGSFTATAASTTSIDLSWTAATGANGYLILQASGGTAPSGAPSDATAYSVSGVIGDGTVAAITAGTSTTITGLTVGTQYSFAIIPFNWDATNAATYNYNTSSIASASAFTQFAHKYRSIATGNWNATATWEVSTDNAVTFGAAATTPTSTDDTVLIQTGHTVTVTASVTADQVTVQTGAALSVNSSQTLTIANGTGTDLDVTGNLTVNGTLDNNGQLVLQTGSTGNVASGGVLKNSGSGAITSSTTTLSVAGGGKYQHNMNAGVVPTATWAATSTVEVVGVTTTVPTANTTPGSSWQGQSLGNIVWNCPNQTATGGFGGSLGTVNGSLTVISTGSGTLRMGASTVYNSVIAGDINIQGGTLDLASGNPATSPSISIGGNYNQTGGTLTYSGAGTNPIEITFTGTNASFTQSAGTFTADKVNFTVAASKSLTLNNGLNTGANASRTMTVNGTLLCNGNNVTGSAAFTLGFGGTLGITDASGITSSGVTGNIRATGVRSFNTGASYIYSGSVAQATGNGLPGAVSNLTIANTGGVTLGANTQVNGTLTVNSSCSLNFNSKTITTGTAPVLNGSLTMPVTRTGANTFTGSKLTQTAGTLTYGGTLTSSLLSGALQNGEAIPLFVSAGGFGGGFSSVTAPTHGNLKAITTQLTGGTGGSITYITLNEHALGTANTGAIVLNSETGKIASRGQAPIVQTTEGSSDVKLTYGRIKNSGCTFNVEFSSDLNTWLASNDASLIYPPGASAGETVVDNGDDMEIVSIKFPIFRNTGSGFVKLPQGYCRINITAP